ncbi:MAG: hypothetical protein DCC57_03820 [Chloroflexi bacterium]|nr:MAG: hypothetical protein DCC57_03820 [Chloroflexota bacterium]
MCRFDPRQWQQAALTFWGWVGVDEDGGRGDGLGKRLRLRRRRLRLAGGGRFAGGGDDQIELRLDGGLALVEGCDRAGFGDEQVAVDKLPADIAGENAATEQA